MILTLNSSKWIYHGTYYLACRRQVEHGSTLYNRLPNVKNAEVKTAKKQKARITQALKKTA